MSTTTHLGSAVARAGVAGNPSDALGGAALAVPVAGLHAEVEICDASRLEFRAAGAPRSWNGVSDLVRHTERYGHVGAERLLSASVVALAAHVRAGGGEIDDSPFLARWRTDIERSVGLAGSSALVIACLRAVAARWEVAIDPPDLAALALRVESVHLGIAAGWMDRAVQAHDAPVLVDTRRCGTSPPTAAPPMAVVTPRRPVELAIAWDPDGAAPSGRLHSALHDRVVAGDPVLARVVDDLASTAVEAAAALSEGDPAALSSTVDRSRALRDELGALDGPTRQLAEVAASAGAAATSAGSGGAVLVVDPDGDLDAAEAAFRRHGCSSRRFVVGTG